MTMGSEISDKLWQTGGGQKVRKKLIIESDEWLHIGLYSLRHDSCETLNIPPSFKISLFPLSFTHCLVIHLSASDSFSTMALYKSYYLLTYLLQIRYFNRRTYRWSWSI